MNSCREAFNLKLMIQRIVTIWNIEVVDSVAKFDEKLSTNNLGPKYLPRVPVGLYTLS